MYNPVATSFTDSPTEEHTLIRIAAAPFANTCFEDDDSICSICSIRSILSSSSDESIDEGSSVISSGYLTSDSHPDKHNLTNNAEKEQREQQEQREQREQQQDQQEQQEQREQREQREQHEQQRLKVWKRVSVSLVLTCVIANLVCAGIYLDQLNTALDKRTSNYTQRPWVTLVAMFSGSAATALLRGWVVKRTYPGMSLVVLWGTSVARRRYLLKVALTALISVYSPLSGAILFSYFLHDDVSKRERLVEDSYTAPAGVMDLSASMLPAVLSNLPRGEPDLCVSV